MPLVEIMKLSLAEVISVLSAKTNSEVGAASLPDAAIRGISTDTRSIRHGDLFIALKGENFHGHNFVGDAFDRGAAAAVVGPDFISSGKALIKVPDTLKALGDLAAYYRSKFNFKCIAITGSNGKTTTKEMLGACLRTRYSTLQTAGNLNNLIGLPMTMFNLDEGYTAGVFELGMSYPGEIDRLAQICQPEIGVFTNIAPVHLESMGTMEAVANAKFELVRRMPGDGTIILNIDDNILATWLGKAARRVVTFGIDSSADFRARSIMHAEGGASRFRIHDIEYRIQLPGKHNIYNALAAIAAASASGCEMKDLVGPLANLRPNNLRSEVFVNGGVTVINDCYNANPVSMRMAIDTLWEYEAAGRKIAVLADMLELGDKTRDYHREIGEYLSLRRIDALFAFGKLSQLYVEHFNGAFKMHFTDKKSLAAELSGYLRPDDVILVKGSRGMALEQISESFRGNG